MKNISNKSTLHITAAFMAGVIVATWILILIYVFALRPSETAVTSAGNEGSTVSEDDTDKSYDTSIKEWELATSSGESFTFYTPEGYYSLADQYIDNLLSYYAVDGIDAKTAVVGDNVNPYTCNTIISADTLSNVSTMLKTIYADDYDPDLISVSEAYTYMTTGELPDELPLNYTIEEAATYTVNGIDFVAYEVNYDTEYPNETESVESTEISENETEPTVMHTQQILCYSDTEDAVEIVISQATFDRDEALSKLQEFLGVE